MVSSLKTFSEQPDLRFYCAYKPVNSTQVVVQHSCSILDSLAVIDKLVTC